MPSWSNTKASLIRRYPFLPEFLKFCVVGFSGTAIDLTIYTLLTRLAGWYFVYATAVSVFVAIGNNFLLNKYWTFKKGQSGRGHVEYVRFFLVSSVAYFMNIGIMYFVVEFGGTERFFHQFNDYFAKAVAIGIVLIINYIGNRYWIFRAQ